MMGQTIERTIKAISLLKTSLTITQHSSQDFMNAIKVTNNLSAGLRTRSEASALRWLREKQSFASETYPPDLQFFAVWDVKSAVGKPFHLECHYPVAYPMPNSKE